MARSSSVDDPRFRRKRIALRSFVVELFRSPKGNRWEQPSLPGVAPGGGKGGTAGSPGTRQQVSCSALPSPLRKHPFPRAPKRACCRCPLRTHNKPVHESSSSTVYGNSCPVDLQAVVPHPHMQRFGRCSKHIKPESWEASWIAVEESDPTTSTPYAWSSCQNPRTKPSRSTQKLEGSPSSTPRSRLASFREPLASKLLGIKEGSKGIHVRRSFGSTLRSKSTDRRRHRPRRSDQEA